MSPLDSILPVPLSGLEEGTGWDLSGLENAAQAYADSGFNQGLANIISKADSIREKTENTNLYDVIKNKFTSAEDVSEASSALGDFKDYLAELLETSETAAKNQAERNETAAFNAWQRSEQAADAAVQRARALRKTSYQDAVSSLKAAGLNPVLAAHGGISGSAVTAPQANAPASTSGMADGLNAADLLMAIASLLSGAGSLIGSINPKHIISEVFKTSK